ncbi:MAG: co-chaperone GroES [Chlorobiota bacterium]|jgi:chaperonin GroES|nr:co-chaperone GroES [Chlorobiota bacterium]
MKLTPLYDRVVIKPAPPEEVTKGGIIIPDTAKEKPQQGEVVAVGKGKLTEDGKLIPLQVKVGDQVLFGKYAGTEVTIDGEEYLIMRESDIYAIINTNGQS